MPYDIIGMEAELMAIYHELLVSDPLFDPIPDSDEPWVVHHSYTVQED